MRLIDDEPDLSAREQLSKDYALFHATEEGCGGETLRFWEAITPVVVLGRSSRVSDDVHEDACAADGVPIIRRFTGGGTVVLGPGSLTYALVLSLVSRPELADVRASFAFILERIAAALRPLDLEIAYADLTLGGCKVGGHAQRRGRFTLFHHGTLLYAFDASLAGRYLRMPTRQPAYRAGRSHREFLANLPLSVETIRARLRQAWPG